MKRILIFISGFVAGVLSTFLVLYIISTTNKSSDSIEGLIIFETKGDCLDSDEIEVFQVLKPNMALATAVKYEDYEIRSITDEIVILLIDNEGKTFYDQQKVKIPDSQCARQIGTYQYNTKDDFVKTVPAVVVE